MQDFCITLYTCIKSMATPKDNLISKFAKPMVGYISNNSIHYLINDYMVLYIYAVTAKGVSKVEETMGEGYKKYLFKECNVSVSLSLSLLHTYSLHTLCIKTLPLYGRTKAKQTGNRKPKSVRGFVSVPYNKKKGWPD